MEKDWSNPYAVPVKSALSYALFLYNSCVALLGRKKFPNFGRTIPSILVRGFCVANFLQLG
jgi:hypothetical protein